MKSFTTIASGATPEHAFAKAKEGLNGKEIISKECFVHIGVPVGEKPFKYANRVRENDVCLKAENSPAGCVLLRKANSVTQIRSKQACKTVYVGYVGKRRIFKASDEDDAAGKARKYALKHKTDVEVRKEKSEGGMIFGVVPDNHLNAYLFFGYA